MFVNSFNQYIWLSTYYVLRVLRKENKEAIISSQRNLELSTQKMQANSELK